MRFRVLINREVKQIPAMGFGSVFACALGPAPSWARALSNSEYCSTTTDGFLSAGTPRSNTSCFRRRVANIYPPKGTSWSSTKGRQRNARDEHHQENKQSQPNVRERANRNGSSCLFLSLNEISENTRQENQALRPPDYTNGDCTGATNTFSTQSY